MLTLTIFFPLFSFICVSLFGRLLGKQGSSIMTIGSLSCSLILTFYYFTYSEQTIYINLFSWLFFGSAIIDFELIFDQTTFIMLFVVLTISLIVHIYSTDYLKTDPHLPRFLSYLSLFTFFMLILISAENFLQLFLGWEGVGLCSYLLISFWFTRIQAGKAALKAVFVNKIGDLALLIAMSLIFYAYGSLSFSVFFSLTPYLSSISLHLALWSFNLLEIIGLFLLIGVVGKSAQIGLHVWLPDAMEGPTPVSALLHAATMVTAGIFLVIRCSFFFEHTPGVLMGFLFIGSLTAFFAATTGLVQNDIKRIIAFSTCSQLGYMLAACGLSQYNVALFHLFNHAFFKALLFLAAGNVIHALSDEQDIRKMGSLSIFLPLTFSYFVIASFSLMGLPYLSGFYSKDFILEQFFVFKYTEFLFFFLFLLLSAASCTAAYSFRLLFYVFFSRPNFPKYNLPNIMEAPIIVQVPLILLTLLSIFSGFLFADFFIGVGSTAFAHSIVLNPLRAVPIDSEFLHPLVKQMPLFFTLSGWVASYYVCTFGTFSQTVSPVFYFLAMFFNQKWFFDKFYNTVVLVFLKNSFYTFYSFLDKGIIEFFGPTGLYNSFWKLALSIRKLQTGIVSDYFLIIFTVFILITLLGLTIL